MTDDQPLRGGPRLSSFPGLQEARIVDSLLFDPISGIVHVVYSPAYIQILQSGFIGFADVGFLGAVALDDPVAMRIWVEATTARRSTEPVPSQPGGATPRRHRKAASTSTEGPGESSGQTADAQASDRRARIFSLGLQVYGDDFGAFLETPRRSLDDETPAELMKRGDDERVLQVLVRAAGGNFG
jgi:hypothetical protein